MATTLPRRILLRSTISLPLCNFSYAESISHSIELTYPSNGLTRSNHDKRTLVTTAYIDNNNKRKSICTSKIDPSHGPAFSSEKYATKRLFSTSASKKVMDLLDNNNVRGRVWL